jgi:uncharacterized phage protein (TIGR02218 family)
MSRIWFAQQLETVASFWRVYRRDGVTFGFTSHDRDLVFDDIRHRTAPGMVPSAIRMTADFADDSAEVTGALDHEAIREDDLDAGRFDGAGIELGLVDWETQENRLLYTGRIGHVGRDASRFTAALKSVKAELLLDPIPRTSPSCRAQFCGPGCGLSAARFTHEARIATVDFSDNAVELADGPDAMKLLDGQIKWVDGERAGLPFAVAAIDGNRLILERALPHDAAVGQALIVREGCDLRLDTCSMRFGNAVNFRGEPFLPGNDMLSRYPLSQ